MLSWVHLFCCGLHHPLFACIGIVVGASVLWCVHRSCLSVPRWCRGCISLVMGALLLSWVHWSCYPALLSSSHWFCHGDKLLLCLSYIAVAISILTLFVLLYLNNSTVKPNYIEVRSQVLLRLDFVFVFRWTACGSFYKK